MLYYGVTILPQVVGSSYLLYSGKMVIHSQPSVTYIWSNQKQVIKKWNWHFLHPLNHQSSRRFPPRTKDCSHHDGKFWDGLRGGGFKVTESWIHLSKQLGLTKFERIPSLYKPLPTDPFSSTPPKVLYYFPGLSPNALPALLGW